MTRQFDVTRSQTIWISDMLEDKLVGRDFQMVPIDAAELKPRKSYIFRTVLTRQDESTVYVRSPFSCGDVMFRQGFTDDSGRPMEFTGSEITHVIPE